MGTQVLVILALFLVNGLFAMSEIAIISARKVRLGQRAEEGDRNAKIALEMAESPNRFLSTVQIGIALIGILAGAFGGATISEELAASLSSISWLKPYSAAVALALVVLGTTYISLVIGELVPKRLAMNNPERIAAAVAPFMRGIVVISSPAVFLLSASTDFVLRALGVKSTTEPPITEEEIHLLLEEGAEAGVFEEREQDMVENVFSFTDRRAGSLMTPRPDVVWIDLDEPVEEQQRKIIQSPYSRFPVGRGSLDNVLGEVNAKALLNGSLTGETFDLQQAVQKPLHVPETMLAPKLLEILRQAGTEMALVIDEYGSVQGVVTLNDVVAVLVGDSPTPQTLNPEAVRREDGTWLFDGKLSIEEFKDLLDLEELPGEEQGFYQTLGGFMTFQLGSIPTVANHFEYATLRYEVLDMDGLRVDKVLVTPLQCAHPGATDE